MTTFLSVRGAKFSRPVLRRSPARSRGARFGVELMGCAALGVVGGVVFFVAWQLGGLIP